MGPRPALLQPPGRFDAGPSGEAGCERGWEPVVSRFRLGGGSWNAFSFEANAGLSLSRSRWSIGEGGTRGEEGQTSVV